MNLFCQIQDSICSIRKVFNDNVSLSPHKLRHTYATNLLEISNDLTIVMKQLGHTSTTTIMLYVHSTQAKAKCAADAMSKRRKIKETVK
ncbi:tyrosine-type recombinase/integrase [Bacillus sp. JJ1521]|uniref:tyrosine-type recombinase/integrase n=1 Tax=Bacillus sp. JJ1521 TaxID=3122957 RepID=UPI003000931D